MTGSANALTRLAAALLALVTTIVALAVGAPARQDRTPATQEIHVLHVQGNVYMLVGAGANITVQVGDNALLLVDTGVPEMSAQVVSAIRTISPKPIEFIINTSADADHTGGNQNLAQAGHFDSGLMGEQPGASIVAHLAVLDRMIASNGKEPLVPKGLWPTDTYDNDRWALFNGEAVIVEHPHAAHTDGDSLVFFRRSDVVSAGDIFTPDLYPMIDLQRGGSINGEIDALNRLIEIMVPKANEEGGTYLIPGHGRLCDRAVLGNYRDMVTIVRDRIKDLVKKGKTLEQIKAAKPTLDFDGEYGADTGKWTTGMFIEAVYSDLSKRNLSKAGDPPGQIATGEGR
jgi:cyclase